jgi:hypothetical protein
MSSSAHPLEKLRAPWQARHALGEEAPPESLKRRHGLRTVYVGPLTQSQDWVRYYTLPNKLSYLVAEITQGDIPQSAKRELYPELESKYPLLAQLRRELYRQRGERLQIFPGLWRPATQNPGRSVLEVCADSQALRRLLFSKGSYLEVQHPQCPRPQYLPTDQGTEDLFEIFYARPSATSQPRRATLSLDAGHQPKALSWAAGEEWGGP